VPNIILRKGAEEKEAFDKVRTKFHSKNLLAYLEVRGKANLGPPGREFLQRLQI
jgi:hypothetical protein